MNESRWCGQARAIGLSVRLLHYGQLAVLSLVVVGALKAVGIILSVAMLVAPGAIAFLLTKRYAAMMVTAVTVAVTSSLAGIYLSFVIDSAPAPTIVLLMTAMFIAVILGTTHKNAPAGFAPLAIGLCLTLIHLVSIPISNTSVNPARSTAAALFAEPWALGQLWVFWVAPIVGAVLGALAYKAMGRDEA